jgi:RNA-splicing ligase RtcB
MTTITGKTLIDLGYKPGPWFKDALAQLDEDMDEKQIMAICDPLVPKHLPLTEGFHPDVFLTPETDLEIENFEGVMSAMQELTCVPTVERAMVMPDACPAGTIPVGGVAAARDAIHPGWHSADICCSVMATKVDGMTAKELLDLVHENTHFGPGGRDRFRMSDYLTACMLGNMFLQDLVDVGHYHMGTQGDGNHFSYVGHDTSGQLWLVTHHGSRGVGAKLYKKGMQVAERFRQKLSPETPKGSAWIPTDSVEGFEYRNALQIVKMWTMENHLTVHNLARKEPSMEYDMWTIHNFVFPKDGLWWHAKGATPGFEGPALLPLNMSEPILILDEARTGWLPHGAGRNMSRTQFKRLGIEDDVSEYDIRFWCGNPDPSELPSAYKPASKVLGDLDQYKLGRLVGQINPYGSIMAGDWEKDKPWRKGA